MTERKAAKAARATTSEPEWKAAFRRAKEEAQRELEEINREAFRRANELLRRAS